MFKKKYIKGGPLKGPSHDNGGIPIEVEGGEFIVKKDSVNPRTEAILDCDIDLPYKEKVEKLQNAFIEAIGNKVDINNNGKLPTDEYDILPTVNAKNRSKK